MATQATAGMGTVIAISNGADPAVYTAIAEVKGITGPSMSAAVIDVTNLDSADNTREFITSLIDPGDISFDVNFLPGNTAQQGLVTDMKNRTKRDFRITWSDADDTVWNFSGLITGFSASAGIDAALSASVTIKITGFPTFV